MLVELTTNETVIGRLEIALTVELVEQELMNATGNLQVCRQQHPLPFLFPFQLPAEEMYHVYMTQCAYI